MKTNYFIFYFIAFFMVTNAKAINFTVGDTIVMKQKKVQSINNTIFDAPIIFKTSPTAILWGGLFPFTAEYLLMAEITTGRTQSDQLGISIMSKGLLLKALENAAGTSSYDVYKVSGYKVQYAHKFYLIPRRRHAPSGFYFGPLVNYTNIHIAIGLKNKYANSYYEFRNVSGNVIVGVQAAKRNRITFEVYGGLGYKSNSVYYHFNTYNLAKVDTKDYGDFFNSNINIVFGINLGYAF